MIDAYKLRQMFFYQDDHLCYDTKFSKEFSEAELWKLKACIEDNMQNGVIDYDGAVDDFNAKMEGK